MIFSRMPKRDPRHMDGEKPFMKFLRYVIIGILFAGVFWGFYMNGQKFKAVSNKTAPAKMNYPSE